MTPRMERVVSPLLSDAPVVSGEPARALLAGLDLAPRTRVPAWITDEGLRASILAGFVDIPDDLIGGAT